MSYTFIALAAAIVLLKMTVFAPPKVKIVTVEKRDLTAQVYGNGTVEAKVVVGISSKITGKVIQLYADQGDHVKKGQLLAKLENDDVIQQQAQSEAEVSRADATLNVEMANLKKARANLELAENNVRRFRDLVGKNLVSKLEAEQYENIYQVAEEEVARCHCSCRIGPDGAKGESGRTWSCQEQSCRHTYLCAAGWSDYLQRSGKGGHGNTWDVYIQACRSSDRLGEDQR